MKWTVLLIAIIVCIPVVYAPGMGVSPGFFSIDGARRGTSSLRDFTFSRTGTLDESTLNIVDDEPADSWFSFPEAETIGENELTFTTSLLLNVPQDAANGVYKGDLQIRFVQPTTTEQTLGVNVVTAVMVPYTITVTDEQIYKFTIKSFSLYPIIEGGPFELSLRFQNEGNVAVQLSRVRVEIFDKFNNIRVATHDITNIPLIHAFTNKDVDLQFKHTLKPDQYWAVVTVFEGEKEIFRDKQPFDVFVPDALVPRAAFLSLTVKNTVVLGELVKISGELHNKGEISLHASLHSEILHENVLKAVLDSEERVVRAGQTQKLDVFYTPEELGEYTVVAHIVYNGEQSDMNSKKFIVQSVDEQRSGLTTAVVILLLIGLGGTYYWKKR